MNVYLISGLGADKRAFAYLTLDPSFKLIYLDWIDALPKETLEEYAMRLAQKIDTTQPFCLIGLSLGGIMASEICTKLKPHKAILLSSVSCYNELPVLYKLGGALRLHKLIPESAGNKANQLLYWLFGLTQKHDKKLLKQVMADSNTRFTKWAMNAVTKWRKNIPSTDIIRIHGDKDRVLPITSFKPDYVIKNGGHLMVAIRAAEVSKILNEILLDK